jgi:hypothetical protein
VNDGARLWVDGQLLIDEWRNGDTREVSRDLAMSGGTHELHVEYYKRSGDGVIKLRWEKTPIPTATNTPITSFPDWKGEYWSNINLAGQPAVLRNDSAINFNWGSGSPDSALPADGFSARWSRSFTFEDGLYRFTVESNEGIRFLLDGALILNEWSDTSSTRINTFDLNLNGRRQLVVEYYERTGEAVARLRWEQLSLTSTPTPTNTPTGTATQTATPTQTVTPSPTLMLTSTPTGTATASPTATGTLTPTATLQITSTATITATP